MKNRSTRIALALFALVMLLAHAIGGARAEDIPENVGDQEISLFSLAPTPDAQLAAAVINTEYPLRSRVQAIMLVAEQATDADRSQRVEWLAALARNSGAAASIRDHAIKQLVGLRTIPQGFVEYLLAEAANGERSEDWRGVCIINQETLYGLLAPAQRGNVAQSLAALVAGDNDAAAGAALLTAAKLSSENPALLSVATQRVETLLGGSAAAVESTLSAIQAAVLLGVDRFLPALRTMALNDALEIRLRMAAAGALGELGTAADLSLLASLRDSTPLLRKVAGNAIATLRSRLGQ